MNQPTIPTAPRDETHYELDWEAVEPRDPQEPRDVLGLTVQDRVALGLTRTRTLDLVPTHVGDANEALREAVLHNASYGKVAPRRR